MKPCVRHRERAYNTAWPSIAVAKKELVDLDSFFWHPLPGTDHGHGTVMLVLGGGIRGGKVHGKWPGLEPEQLFERRDLAVTTDYRDVFAEVLVKHHGVPSIAKVFPGYAAKKAGII